MNDLEKRLAIKAEVTELPIGATTNDVKCPWCNQSKSFAVTKSHKGDILFMCHRASCGQSGYIRERGVRGPATQGWKFTPRVYNDTTVLLEGDRLSELVSAYRLSETEIHWAGWLYAPGRGALVMPVYSPHWARRGVVTKFFDPTTIPKTITYKEVDDVWMGWYIRDGVAAPDSKGKYSQVIVVEDAISCLKASRYAPAVALYGTHLNMEMLKEILSVAGDEIVLCLDKDATQKAYNYSRQFAVYGNFRTIPLSKDLKDMNTEELGAWSERL